MDSQAHGELTHSHDGEPDEGSIADRLILRIVSSRRALVRVVSYMLAEQRRDRRYSAMSTLSTRSTLSTISNVSTVSSLSSRPAASSESADSASPLGPTRVGAAAAAACLPLRSLPPSPPPTASATGSFATLNQILSASLNKRKRPETHYDGIPISVILAHAQDPSNPSLSAASSSSCTSSPAVSSRGDRKISSTRRVGLARMLGSLDMAERANEHGRQEMRGEWDVDHRMGEGGHSSSEEEDQEEEDDDDDDDLIIIV